MHIAYLTPEYPHERVRANAGIGTSVKNLAEALAKNNHHISIFIYGQFENATFEENGINFHLIKQKHYKVGGFYFYRKHVQHHINAHAKSIDILEAVDWTGMTAFMNFQIPHVIRLHGSDTYFCHLEGRKQKWKNRFFEKMALKNAVAITSVSAFTARVTKELFSLTKNITVIHNLIDLDKFSPQHDVAVEDYVLNYGSIIRKKGVIALAQAFNELHNHKPQLRLRYLGKDVIDAQTGKLTSELILDCLSPSAQSMVDFIEPVAYEAVKEYIIKAKLICLPSYAEAFPMTWLETMALQKPLLTSNIGWAQEIMKHEVTGLAIHPDDCEAMVNGMLKLLNDEMFALTCGLNARKHLEMTLNKQDILQANLDFYKKACHE